MLCQHFDYELDCDFSKKLFEELDDYISKHKLEDHPTRIENTLGGMFINKVHKPGVSGGEFIISRVHEKAIYIRGVDMYSGMLLQGYYVPELIGVDFPCSVDEKLYFLDARTGHFSIVRNQLIVDANTIHVTSDHRISYHVVSQKYKEKLLAIL